MAKTDTGTYYLGASQDVTIGAASVQSVAVGAQTKVVRIKTTGEARILISKNPTALSTSTLISTGDTEYFDIHGGEKVAVIQDGASTGTVNITEVSK